METRIPGPNDKVAGHCNTTNNNSSYGGCIDLKIVTIILVLIEKALRYREKKGNLFKNPLL